MEDKKISDLLSTEEKAAYFEIKSLLLQIGKDISEAEYYRLYKKACKILLTAVNREIDRRKATLKIYREGETISFIKVVKRRITKMFEVVVRLNDDWIDISGVTDTELFKALSDWSSGKEEIVKLNTFTFNAQDIISLTVSR
jgi:hypothetical protein